MTEKKLSMAEKYDEGFRDGLTGRPPNMKMMALGSTRMNGYERGYVAGGAEHFRVAADHLRGIDTPMPPKSHPKATQ